MRLSRSALAGTGVVAVATLLTLGLSSTGSASGAAAPASRGIGDLAGSKIKHVVIIYQENHTFDDELGEVCEKRTTPCDGYTGAVTFADGTTAANVVQPDVVPIVKHDPPSQRKGIGNKWDQIEGCTRAPYVCVSHVDPAKIPNIAALADTFAVSDATFAAGDDASFGAHENLGSGTSDGWLGYNPVKSKSGHKPGPGWGCPSFRDALWGPDGEHVFVPSCIPDSNGAGPYRSSPVKYVPTIMQRVEQAGLSWHIYQGSPRQAPLDTSFSICTYFQWCVENRFNTTYDSATNAFYKAARNGRLPSLSILLPTGGESQHNGTSMAKGDNYVGQIVQAVEDSPQWRSSAVFLTYDDCGCFYDHVTPPAGLGLRNPLVIVSPWAKPDSTDSTVAVQPYSILSFVENNFGLAPLSTEVSEAYDYSGSFDFSQRPLSGVGMTRTSISASERERLAKLRPVVARDPV